MGPHIQNMIQPFFFLSRRLSEPALPSPDDCTARCCHSYSPYFNRCYFASFAMVRISFSDKFSLSLVILMLAYFLVTGSFAVTVNSPFSSISKQTSSTRFALLATFIVKPPTLWFSWALISSP